MITLIGRRSSLFTRVARIVAHDLGIPYDLQIVSDLTATDAHAYGDNPALKLPALRHEDGTLLVGTENICRAFAELAGTSDIIWPEAAKTDDERNLRELVAHAMAAQIQLAFGTIVCKLPADNTYFVKGRTGFEGALRWIDAHVALVNPKSYVAIELFCLVEHLTFRGTLPVDPYPNLVAFARDFAARASAVETAYRFDT